MVHSHVLDTDTVFEVHAIPGILLHPAASYAAAVQACWGPSAGVCSVCALCVCSVCAVCVQYACGLSAVRFPLPVPCVACLWCMGGSFPSPPEAWLGRVESDAAAWAQAQHTMQVPGGTTHQA